MGAIFTNSLSFCPYLMIVLALYGCSSSVQISNNASSAGFTSLETGGALEDGYLNAAEIASNEELVKTLSASGFDSAEYAITSASNSCNESLNYQEVLLLGSVQEDLSDGPQWVCVKLSDSSGAVIYGNSAEFIRDTVSPATPTVSNAEWYNSLSSTPSTTWSSSDNGSGIDRYEVAVGTSSGDESILSWRSLGANLSYQYTNLSLSDGGTYYFSVRAVDKAGNTSAVAADSWGIDLTAPSAPSLTDGTKVFSLSSSPDLSWSAATDSSSGVAKYEVSVGTSAGATDIQDWVDVGTDTSKTLTGLSLTAGTTYYPNLRVTDAAGNVSSVSSGDGWIAAEMVQTGSVTLSSGVASVDVTIEDVEMDKAFLLFTMKFDDTSGVPTNSWVSGQITATDTLTFARAAAGTIDVEIQWQVVEFLSGVTVQRGILHNPANASASVDVTINSVDRSKAWPIISVRATGTAINANDHTQATLTSDTNLDINFYNGSSGSVMSSDMYIAWQVIEYEDAVVQYGTHTMTSGLTSDTVAITAVDLSSSWLVAHNTNLQGSFSSPDADLLNARFSATDELTFERVTSGVSARISYYVVSFTDDTSVQSGNISFSTTDTDLTASISSVDTSKSIVMTSGALYGRSGKTDYSADENYGPTSMHISFQDSTNLDFSRGVTGSANTDANWFLIEFQP